MRRETERQALTQLEKARVCSPPIMPSIIIDRLIAFTLAYLSLTLFPNFSEKLTSKLDNQIIIIVIFSQNLSHLLSEQMFHMMVALMTTLQYMDMRYLLVLRIFYTSKK